MQITLAVEDILSESVAHRLLQDYAPNLQPSRTEGLTGYGQLKSRFASFSMIARYREPVLLITDLDNPQSCPLALIQEWRKSLTPEPNLLFRVAVMEIESWLIADRAGISKWLSIANRRVPRLPESLPRPKESLVGFATRSRKRALREAIVPRPGSTNKVGPGYNDALGNFAMNYWNPEEARSFSPSLHRAITRITAFSDSVPSCPSHLQKGEPCLPH